MFKRDISRELGDFILMLRSIQSFKSQSFEVVILQTRMLVSFRFSILREQSTNTRDRSSSHIISIPVRSYSLLPIVSVYFPNKLSESIIRSYTIPDTLWANVLDVISLECSREQRIVSYLDLDSLSSNFHSIKVRYTLVELMRVTYLPFLFEIILEREIRLTESRSQCRKVLSKRSITISILSSYSHEVLSTTF